LNPLFLKHILFIIALFFLASIESLYASPRQVALLLSNDRPLYHSIANKYSTTLVALDGSIAITKQYMDQKTTNNTLSFINSNFVIAIGTKACQKLKTSDTQLPSLCIYIPRSTFETLYKTDNHHITALYLDQPIDRQLKLIRLLLPGASSIGTLLGPVSFNEKKSIQNAASRFKFKADIKILKNRDPTAVIIKSLVTKNDIILTVPDPVVMTPQHAKWLLYIAYRQRIPVIGFSKAYVTAGALAALYSKPGDFGHQAAIMTHQAMLKSSNQITASAYPDTFEISINYSVAKTLNIDLPKIEWLKEKMNNSREVMK